MKTKIIAIVAIFAFALSLSAAPADIEIYVFRASDRTPYSEDLDGTITFYLPNISPNSFILTRTWIEGSNSKVQTMNSIKSNRVHIYSTMTGPSVTDKMKAESTKEEIARNDFFEIMVITPILP